MKKVKYTCIAAVVILILFASPVQSQNGVGINSNGAAADSSAMLDVVSTTRGLLMPRMTLGQMNAIANPATGLIIYVNNGGATGFYYYDGTKWVRLAFGGNTSDNWSLTGNLGTTAGTNFIGTTDGTDFVMKTNNVEGFRLYNGSKVAAFGVGAGATPTTTSNYASIVLRGLNGNMQMNLQDGGARASMLWNATGTQGNYEVTGEPSAYIGFVNNGTAATEINFYSAAAGTAGNPINWTQMSRFVGSSQIWLSPRGTSTDFYINSSGEIGLGTSTPTAQVHIGGTYTTANSNRTIFGGTMSSSATTSQSIINAQMNFSPTASSLINVIGGSFNPVLTGSSLAITSMYGLYVRTDLNSGFTGSVANGVVIEADNPVLGSGQSFPAFSQLYGAAVTNGNGITTGTVNNRGVHIQSATAAAALGGTVNNYGGLLNLGTGAGAGTTTNYGLYINGNGGSGGTGTTNNWSLYSNSTAYSYFAGNVGIGTNAPIYPLFVVGNSSNTSSNFAIADITGSQNIGNSAAIYGLNVSNTYTAVSGNTLNTMYGVVGNPGNTSSGTITSLNGVTGRPNNLSSGVVTSMLGIGGYPGNSSSGTVGSMYGVYSEPQKTGTGAVTAAYAYYGKVDNTNAAGAITNAYGLYIDNPTTTGSITNNYAIITAGSAGYVGLGTTTPNMPLHVQANKVTDGSLNAQSQIGDNSAYNASPVSGLKFIGLYNSSGQYSGWGGITMGKANATDGDYASYMAFHTRINGVAITERMRIDQSGNVGIGTTTPARKLQVSGGNVDVVNESTYAIYTATNYSGNSTGEGPHFYGLRGRGTIASPSDPTTNDLLGAFEGRNYRGTTWGGMLVFAAENQSASAQGNYVTIATCPIGSVATAVERMRVTDAGNVGIGCSTPKYTLHVIGDIASSATVRSTNTVATGAITACSDIRFKKQIAPLPNSLENILKLQGVNYYWKQDEFPDRHFSDKKQIGFIAQEIEKIYPEVVLTDVDGYKAVDYSKLTPVLVEAIKELTGKLSSQEEKNSQLQKEVEDLQLHVGQLSSSMKQAGITHTETTSK